jgi:GT2 family glycosyltransferase
MISIIIPIYNQHDMTHECIYAVFADTKDCELILIDNGSDVPFKPPYSGFIETTLIRNEENKGFPVAINQGIRASKGDVIILLNNDVIVTPGWADKLSAWLDEFSIVAPLSNYCAGMQQVQVGAYATKEGLNEKAEEWAGEHTGMV